MLGIKPAISLKQTQPGLLPDILGSASFDTATKREHSYSDYRLLEKPARPGIYTQTNQIADIADQFEDVIALRHGFAKHNELGIFNGSPEFKDLYGLTKRGIAEIQALVPALLKWAQSSDLPIVIVASDFLRTIEVGEIINSALSEHVIRFELKTELRERDPGILEGVAYQKILSRFGISTEAEKIKHNRRSKNPDPDKIKVPWKCRSRLLATSSQRLLRMESNQGVTYRTTSLLREKFFEQRANPCRYILVGHEFSLGPALSAFLAASKRVKWNPGLYWMNRHIPRSTVFSMNLASAERHYLDREPLRI